MTRSARTGARPASPVVALGVGTVGVVVLAWAEVARPLTLCILVVTLLALVAFDRIASGRLRRATFLVPLAMLYAVAEALWLRSPGFRPDLGVVVQGAVVGALSALLAIGLALIYRTNRVINFAQADLGLVPAVLAILMMSQDAAGGAPDWMTGLPYPVAFLVGLGIALALGLLVERVLISRFARAPRLVLTVATIGVAQVLTALALFIPGWFGFTATAIPTVEPPFDLSVEVGGVVLENHDLVVLVVVPLILASLAWFLRRTKTGMAMRAVAERSSRAAMLGIPVARIQTTIWVITTALAFVTVFLRAGVSSFPVGSALGVTILVRALGAAVIGRFEDFPRIAAAAVGLGVLEQAIVFGTGRDLLVFPVVFVVIVAALLLDRGDRVNRLADQAVSSWAAAREIRPVPAELRGLTEVRAARVAAVVGCVVFALTLPWWTRPSDLTIATAIGVVAIVAVSLVLLTGWAGHVSLGQMAFAAVGGAVGGWATQVQGWNLEVALLAGGVAGALLAVVVGLPAARLGGLTLAVTTLALSSAVLFWLLNPEVFGWLPRGRFSRDPVLFGRLTIASPASYYFLTLGVLALTIAMVHGLRRSRTGRALIALRDNRRNAEAFGLNATRTMLVAFGFSGFFAALAGVLLVHSQHMLSNNIVGNPFGPEQSIAVFATVVIGGLASLPGAMFGAAYVYGVHYYLPDQWSFLATGFGLLLMLLVLPGGLGAAVAQARDSLLRWRARAHDLIVPSLLADRREPDHPPPTGVLPLDDTDERDAIEEVAEMWR